MADIHQSMAAAGARATPPVVVSAASTLSHAPLQDWVYILTLVYLVVQIGYLLWKWWRAIHRREPAGDDQ
jgi:hypothetical protein